jgi:transcription antitermination factor NusG
MFSLNGHPMGYIPFSILSNGQGGKDWYLVHTAAHQENALAKLLFDSSITYFLPRAPTPTNKSKSRKPKAQPLFPRYLFAHGSPQIIPRIKAHPPGFKRVVSLSIARSLDLTEQLRSLLAALVNAPEAIQPPTRFEPGQQVMIRPPHRLAGMAATVRAASVITPKTNSNLVYLDLPILQQSVPIEVPAKFLRLDDQTERETFTTDPLGKPFQYGPKQLSGSIQVN